MSGRDADSRFFPYAKFDEHGRMTRRFDREVYARRLAEAKALHDVGGAEDLVVDPRYAVPVSRFGQEGPARVRDTETARVQDPADPERAIQVRRVKSALVEMHRVGVISETMLLAGLHFQKHFDIASKCRFASCDLMTVGGGGSIEDVLTGKSRASLVVQHYLGLLSYPNTVMSKALLWMVGYGFSMDDLADMGELHDFNGQKRKDYWRAMLVSALQVIAADYERRFAAKAKLRGESSVRAEDYNVIDGAVRRANRRYRKR